MSYELPQFVKNWLDELVPAARDRVVKAPIFFTGHESFAGDENGTWCSCLVGTAHANFTDRYMYLEEANWTVAQWFPRAVERDGYDVVVAAIKGYLARDNPRIEVVVPEPEVAVTN